MAKVIKNNLGFLGIDFQYKLIKTFMEEPNFFRELYPIIDQNMFTDPTLKVYVGVLKEYFAKNDLIPSYTMMGIKLHEKAYSEIELETYDATIKKIKETSTEGVDEIRELAQKFFKQQNMIRVANELLKVAGDGDIDKYDDCVKLLEEANNVGGDEDMGESPLDDTDEVLSDDYRITIPTGIKRIDEALEGGIGVGELGVIIGPSSFGKVQPNDALVVTPNGFKKMGDIKVGDHVIGKNGKPIKVIGVYPHKNWEFYKVTFSDGVSCECGMEHLWNVNSIYQRIGKKYIPGLSKHRNDKYYMPDYSFKTLSLRDIVKKGLYRVWGGKKMYNFKIPMCEPIQFNYIPITIDPYLIGYIIGKGNFKSGRITIGKKDVESCKDLLINDDNKGKIFLNNKKTYIISYPSFFIKKLANYYDLSITSECKYIHHDYLYNSMENRILLLNGLMDSDGTCHKNGCSCYNTKSKQLAEDVKQLVLSLGGFAVIRNKKCRYFNTKYNEYRDCGIQYEVTISLCDPTIPIFKLKRKQERVIYRRKKKNDRFISKVEFSRISDGQCIKVDADDELYLTNDFIVTHNTSLTTAMASYAASYKCEANDYKGFKVLQIVFEDRVKQIKRKHIGRITQVEAKDLSKPEYIDIVKHTLDSFPDRELIKENIRIKKYPSGEKSPNDIKNFIKKLRNSGFVPKLVIIDYFECLVPDKEKNSNSNDSEWSKEGRTMRKLETMAEEFGVAIWVPTQGTKDSIGAELVTMDKSGGSIKKIQIGHIVMSIARSMENIKENKANIAILKNRAGQAGLIINGVNFNNGTCTISTDDVIEFDDALAYHEHENNEKAKMIFETGKEVFNQINKKNV